MKLRQLKDYEEERKPASISLIVQAVALEFRDQPEHVHELAAAIRSAVSVEPETFALLDANEEDAGFNEGRVLEQLHRRHERNRTAVRKKIAQVLAATGKLACEACGFDFQAMYGERGEGFAECHHIVPLSEAGERKTRLDELAIVCANCHRMIHRASPMWTVEEVRQHLTR
ncbi:HNH endonuclease [Deinococcus marmoris]|uniref:HNH endonuclease n=2 Tax=Deinococcus marmoris TaxID=249408 RepID=A0A1U7NZN6_9DEIO|nr:HNH endonuclease [Deinococcus marmoris]